MKNLIILILILSTQKGCGQFPEQSSVSSVTYTAMTRGSSYTCIVKKESIHIDSSVDKENQKRNISLKEWESVSALIDSSTLNDIHKFEAPTKESATDRARIATLVLMVEGKTYESAPFDEGNPPEELRPLIEMILRLAKTVE